MEIDVGLEPNERARASEELKKLLADTYTLYLKTHNYHWNVTGPSFATLHALFMEQYTELWAAVDEVAERIRALGAEAPGSYKEFAALTSINEDAKLPDAGGMIRNLVLGHEAVVKTARKVLQVAQEAGDDATVDLATQRIRIGEKTAWMLRSLTA
jgi:starvation-inducible DNA-binding protein